MPTKSGGGGKQEQLSNRDFISKIKEVKKKMRIIIWEFLLPFFYCKKYLTNVLTRVKTYVKL